MKDFVIHDIESMIHLNTVGVFDKIRARCNIFCASDYKLINYSRELRIKVRAMASQGFDIIEIGEEFNSFHTTHNGALTALGLGDTSSLYLAKSLNSTLITNSTPTYHVAQILGINVIKTKEFVNQKIDNEEIKLIINQILKDEEIEDK